MKVVVAGGSGFIGRNLVPALLAAGWEVVVLSRSANGTGDTGARRVRWGGDDQGWTTELADAGAVINLAGASVGVWPWTAGRKRRLRDSRLEATGALVDAIARLRPEQRPRVLLSASGSDVYVGRDEIPADETTAPAGTFLARVGIEWEAAARRAGALGVRVVLLRMAHVLAPGSPLLRRLSLPIRLFLGGPIGSGRQWISWIDARDLADIVLLALRDDALGGVVNAAAPEALREAEFIGTIARVLDRPAWLRVPALLIRLVMGDQATLLLDSRRMQPGVLLDRRFEFHHPDLEGTLRHSFGRQG